jgi:putative transposase
MLIRRGYRTELDLTNKQQTHCLQHAGAARFAYNWGLSRKIAAYRLGLNVPSAIDLHRKLNKLKKTKLPWLYSVSKCAPQEALRNVDAAYKNFLRKVKRKKAGRYKGKTGFPKFKKKSKGIGSFRLTGVIKVFSTAIQLPRFGKLRLKEHDYLPISGVHILCATVSEQAGRWFVSVQIEEDIPEPQPATGAPMGIDLGIRTLATLSDGTTFANPRALEQQLRKLKRLSRAHSRKQKGSKNREKARKQLAKLHARIANMRRDSLHKATARIVAKTKPAPERPALIVLEDLHIAGMLKNHNLARAIADVGMSEFKRQLAYKAAQAGIVVKYADRWYASTKICSMCGWVNENIALSQRVFVCTECGYTADRDHNAAKNILAVSSPDSLNACGAASSGSLMRRSEPSRVEAGTKQQIGKP